MNSSSLLMTEPKPATSAPGARVDVQLRLLPASSRAEALQQWRQLEQKLGHQRLTSSSIWTEIWLNHYGAMIPHQFAVGTRGGMPCGMALLTQGVSQNAGPFVLNTWHVGTAGEPESDSVCVEYNSLLVGPEDRLDFSRALWTWVQQSTDCDELRLDGFDTPLIEPFLALHPEAMIERKTSYFFDLEAARANGEEPLMRLGSHTRGNIRRNFRDFGEVRGEWAETTARAEELFRRLVELHQARWTSAGEPGVYSSRRFLEFHQELFSRTVSLGLTTVFAVTAGDQLIGCCQVLIDNRRVLLYQCGRAPASGRTSIGLALDYQCICEALRRGYVAIDFLAGDSDHKRRLSTDRAELAWVTWQRPNFKNKAIGALRQMKRMTRQFGRSNADHGDRVTDLKNTASQIPLPQREEC